MLNPTSVETIFVILAAAFFCLPFFVWTIIRFRERVMQRMNYNHKWWFIGSIIIGFTLFIIFLIIGLVIY